VAQFRHTFDCKSGKGGEGEKKREKAATHRSLRFLAIRIGFAVGNKRVGEEGGKKGRFPCFLRGSSRPKNSSSFPLHF